MTGDARAAKDFEQALRLLLSHGMEESDFIIFAERAPEAAARMIDANWPSFQRARDKTKNTVLLALWKVKEPTRFIRDIAGEDDPDKLGFVLRRLLGNATDFSRDDLAALTAPEFHFLIRDHAGRALGRRLAEIADELGKTKGISADVDALKRSVRTYGFSPELNEALDKARVGLDVSGDGFDHAATIRTLRSFFEQFLRESAEEIHRRKSALKDGTNLSQCQSVIDYLFRIGVIQPKMKDLGRALYGILSGEGVHPLKAEREYIRFCWNFVVEFAKIILFELERFLAT